MLYRKLILPRVRLVAKCITQSLRFVQESHEVNVTVKVQRDLLTKAIWQVRYLMLLYPTFFYKVDWKKIIELICEENLQITVKSI